MVTDENGCLQNSAEGLEGDTVDVDVKVKKLQKRKPPTPQARKLPVPTRLPHDTTAGGPISEAFRPTSAITPNYEDVYIVSSTYTIPYVSEETTVISLHSELDEANEVARRYLENKPTDLQRWNEYSEHFNPHEGGIHIAAASNMDADSFIVTVRKQKLERKPQMQQVPPQPLRSPSPELREIFLVTVEKRRDVCGSNGDLEGVEVRGAFRTLEDADEFAEEEMERLVVDGEWYREEREGGGMLVLVATEWNRDEVVVKVSGMGLG